MERVTFQELCDRSDQWKKAVIVYKEESFEQSYSLESRSYEVSSDNKHFRKVLTSYSLFGSSLDGSDKGVRLDRYMYSLPEDGLGKRWEVEYCYIIE